MEFIQSCGHIKLVDFCSNSQPRVRFGCCVRTGKFSLCSRYTIYVMNAVAKAWCGLISVVTLVFILFTFFSPGSVFARNIIEYKDVLSNSNPLAGSNHTLSFTLNATISPGSYIEVTPPPGFEVLGTSTFAADRNVELKVDGITRAATTTLSATTDMVEIIPGSPGLIRYTLNTSSGISSGAKLQLRIGNNTTNSLTFGEVYSTSTGTTTIDADIKPIINASTTGTKRLSVRIFDGGQVADADFVISLVNLVGVGPVDTTEEIPPERFNGAPSSTVSGVTLNVEIFVETNELAICKYSLTPGVAFSAMGNTFANTGKIYHTTVVAVSTSSLQSFYVRCIDDEGNFNIDDYLIQFDVTDAPSGIPNDEGDHEGDGSGSGDSGTGGGGGGGGTEGESNGDTPNTGGSSGTGGSGGGGGGGSGGGSGTSAGGGFESVDGPYRSGDGRVTINGYAYPRSEVVVLVDGKEAQRTRSGANGDYSITVDKIARGVYTFGVYAIDPDKNRSSTFSTSFTVTGARTSALSNINIPPTVKASPDPVNPGTTLTFSGYGLPNSVITIENEKEGSSASRKTLTAVTNSTGVWSTTLATDGFSNGTYKVRVKSVQSESLSTNFSNYVLYGVGQTAIRPLNADLNRDGKVNLIDFSILLFWWGTDGGNSDPAADINADAKVNLTDFSILLFNWTG